MNESRDTDLLIDIARLLKKYGPEPFDALSQRLKDGRFLHDLTALLDASAQIGRRAERPIGAKPKTPRHTTRLEEMLARCEIDNPEKAAALRQVREKLASKALLPSLRDICNFADDNGLPIITAKSRDKAVGLLILAMAALPTERVTSLLARSSPTGSKGERSLEGWTDVILGKRDKEPPEGD